jgi:3-hydroxyisobutyrate dehydrogenase-like beta-hydroxyacid dehydrogenase
MNLGVIGLGMMGRGIAQSLLRAGHRVTVWNRTPSRAEELQSQGALIALTPADACKDGVVITCLSEDDAVKAVVFGDYGIANAVAGCIHISMSTLGLDLILQLNKTHKRSGAAIHRRSGVRPARCGGSRAIADCCVGRC